MKRQIPVWLLLALMAMVLNGLWGALIEIPEKRLDPSFPTSLGYVVWSITFIPCSLYVLKKVNWALQHDGASIARGLTVGLLGGAGQLMLFEALRHGPAFIVFPIISVYPLVTIILSVVFLKETTNRWAAVGIILAVIAIVLLSVQEPQGQLENTYRWLWFTICGFFMWGLQGFFSKAFIKSIGVESMFFYLTISNLFFIPFAIYATDFSTAINWTTGLYTTAAIQILNAIATLMTFYAVLTGKVIIVSPVSALAPVITTILSLVLYARVPYTLNLYGILLSLVSLALITYGEVLAGKTQSDKQTSKI